MDALLAEVLALAAPHRASGKVAGYIPALAQVDQEGFEPALFLGIAPLRLVGCHGRVA